MNQADVTRAMKAARRYRDLGLSPLPSATTEKRPTLAAYSRHRSEPLGIEWFDAWGTTNIQLMTGVNAYGARKIVVVDCDGPEAIERFVDICDKHDTAPEETWRVTTGGGGMHVYFLAPSAAKVASGLVWGLWDTYEEGWAKHKEIRILGNSSLVVAPPSIHVETGLRYRFLGSDPVSTPVPAVAPAWLLAMPRLGVPRFGRENTCSVPIVKTSTSPKVRFVDRKEVLDAIPDKAALAASWGLRIASQPNPSGWMSVHAVGREDRTPSGSFDSVTGCYQDRMDLVTISLFDLGVRLGHFDTWMDCRDWCGSKFLGSRAGGGSYYPRVIRGAPAN